MPLEVKVPALGESIQEVQVSAWLKQPGDSVSLDEPLIELETDKATVEVPAPAAGVVLEIVAAVGAVLKVGDVLARIEAGGAAKVAKPAEPAAEATPAAATAKPAVPARAAGAERTIMPAARRVLAENALDADLVTGTGPGGRVLKEDAVRAVAGAVSPAAPVPAPAPAPAGAPVQPLPAFTGERRTRTVRMSPIRRKIAERLVQAQRDAALLTTFNEIDLSRVKALRSEHQEAFQARYGVKLGIMSFFVKAAVEALQMVPEINAGVEGDSILYHDYCDIGIAVGGGKGLVVPVIRNAEGLGFGDLERIIADFAKRAQANKLDLDELQGGTFTISNGGIFGSLLSTPIVNPPQSGVLGLHAIQDRPVAINGQVVIRPMMYVALTYDHRLVDGRESVAFLAHIKHCVEQPERLLLKV
ncbi:MAG: 2-oxoglutarate dehydrogenase complex dihydrolipoyllysine-residue succinyltransferase [bacterium]|jgi:2-oxoglutarate dehydrogenase E2 component (dihydrolipoamide succinyltransferase)|nr:2-oxoglutarate dehydrogenase complex dihydrolipoyllysine-residue succinyltransferase [bacterium]